MTCCILPRVYVLVWKMLAHLYLHRGVCLEAGCWAISTHSCLLEAGCWPISIYIEVSDWRQDVSLSVPITVCLEAGCWPISIYIEVSAWR